MKKRVLSDWRYRGGQIKGVLYQSVFDNVKKIINALIEKQKEPTSNKHTGMSYDEIMSATGVNQLPLVNAILFLVDSEIIKIEGDFTKTHNYYWLVTLDCENPVAKFKRKLNERK